MAPAYFDSSVFLAILAKQPEAAKVRSLLAELKADKVRIYTSILTVQEVSVSAFMHGGTGDHHTQLAKMARIKGVTRDIALNAAKYEAAVLTEALKSQPKTDAERIKDNRRRKFDLFHIATAVALNCATFYAFDDKYENRCKMLGLGLQVRRPEPKNPPLPLSGAILPTAGPATQQ